MVVGIDGEAGFGIQASRVTEEKPELWIIRSRLRSALCVDDRLLVVAAFECGFRRTCEAGVLDIRAPSQLPVRGLRLRRLRLIGSRLRLCAVVGSNFVRLRENISGKEENGQGKNGSSEASRSNNQDFTNDSHEYTPWMPIQR